MREQVILVNGADEVLGSAEKISAHENGMLHRAFSIFVFNSMGQLLIQRRAKSKYHSGHLWSNTCCGHPRPNESLPVAAHRRIREEMGFDCLMRPAFSFIYKAQLTHSLLEHEYDHVLIAVSNQEPHPNPN